MSKDVMNSVLLTGATGFLGKVILTDLIRRKAKLELKWIYLLIRPKPGQSAIERFAKLRQSPCFAGLPAQWDSCVKIAAGDAEMPMCGLEPELHSEMSRNVTHVIHCAASVKFDQPVRQAAQTNITAALNVLWLAEGFSRLRRLVAVSTAYVTPHDGYRGVAQEKLVELPRPAAALYAEIMRGDFDRKEALEELFGATGHPNTYTLTKCIAEHLLHEHRKKSTVVVVRPSIVSAAENFPFPGWIDSYAAFAGLVALTGSGFLRALAADPNVRLDIIPCDHASNHILNAAFPPAIKAVQDSFDNEFAIRHAVAGVSNSFAVQECVDTTLAYFTKHPVQRNAHLAYVGTNETRFLVNHFCRNLLLPTLAVGANTLLHRRKNARRALKLHRTLSSINSTFKYFTHNTFDFRSAQPFAAAINRSAYLRTVCEGVHRHLLLRETKPVSKVEVQHACGQCDESFGPALPDPVPDPGQPHSEQLNTIGQSRSRTNTMEDSKLLS